MIGIRNQLDYGKVENIGEDITGISYKIINNSRKECECFKRY